MSFIPLSISVAMNISSFFNYLCVTAFLLLTVGCGSGGDISLVAPLNNEVKIKLMTYDSSQFTSIVSVSSNVP